MDYRILKLIQQDRSAGIHDQEEEELDPKVLEVFQWLEDKQNEPEEKKAEDYSLEEAIKAVGGHKIIEVAELKFDLFDDDGWFMSISAKSEAEAIKTGKKIAAQNVLAGSPRGKITAKKQRAGTFRGKKI